MLSAKNYITFLLVFTSLKSYAATIVIDPGHGGHDCGTWTMVKKRKICEKNLALEFSKKLKKRLSKSHTVLLTRQRDEFIDLRERAKIVEKVKADLLISVHINSHQRKDSNGFEMFYLSSRNSEAAKKLEKSEDYFQIKSEPSVSNILADLVIQKTAPISKKLALKIHSQIKKKTLKRFKLKDRGIHPAVFFVLSLAKKPAVLIELGFLSNTRDRRTIFKKSFQDSLAKDISVGIDSFFKKQKKIPQKVDLKYESVEEDLPLF